MRGEMLWFNGAKDLGFIRTEEGERLAVHASGFLPGNVLPERCAGMPVSFTRRAWGPTEAEAVSVTIVVEKPARRARLRRQGSVR